MLDEEITENSSKLILENIKFKNFLSYGEMGATFDLNRFNHVTCISAKNGRGKSTITEAISVCLFNKSIRKSKKLQLVNRKNKKNCLLECNLISDGIKYLVRRGIKPDIFEIYIREDVLTEDGTKKENLKLINESSSSRDYQKILENEILKTNFTNFTQSVIISKTLYTPFMSLPALKRREFVENTLKLKVFSTMSKLNKPILDKLKDDLFQAEVELKNVNYAIELEENNISKFKDMLDNVIISINKDLKDKLNEEYNSIKEKCDKSKIEWKNKINLKLSIENDDKALDLIKLLKYDIQHINSDVGYLENELMKQRILNEKVISKLSDLDDDINGLKINESNDKNTCGSCGQRYTEEHLQKHLITLESNKAKLITANDLYKAKLDNLEKLCIIHKEIVKHNSDIDVEISFIKVELKNDVDKLNKIKNSLDLIEKDIEKNNRENETTLRLKSDIEKSNNKLKDLYANKETILKNIDSINTNIKHREVISNILKDDGVKAYILNGYIPTINRLINKNLSDFGFFVKFEFDNEFNEKILVKGFEESSYENFSEGEKLRIDMSILLAWRSIAMLKNAMTCNVLFLDEITDASMDDEGIEVFTKMLSMLKNNNVFVITHKPEKLENVARSNIRIDKDEYGYSKIL